MPGPPPPPPPVFNVSTSGSNEQDRNLLLQSIRAGKTLRKTVTVDKSAPAVPGRVKGESLGFLSNSSSSSGSTNNGGNGPNTSGATVLNNNNGGPMGLGGLFANGMPKLKPTGLRGNPVDRDTNSSVNNPNLSQASSIGSSHTIKRGLPPVPPSITQKPLLPKQTQTSTDSTSTTEATKSFGKPTLAPKPSSSMASMASTGSTMTSKPSPPPKKLNLTCGGSVARAQSMRLTRSPPVLAPTPPSLHQSQDCLNEPHPRPANRVLRHPGTRPPSPPTSKVNPNTSGTPGSTPTSTSTITRAAPPPPSRVTVTAPCIPPPPPPLPHRPAPAHQRLAPPPPVPVTPPTRGVSLRNDQAVNSIDLEVRFAELFHSVSQLPSPEPFRGFTKVYNSRNAAKQQAPPPPLQTSSNSNTMLPLNSSGGKQWQHSTASLAC